MPGKKKKPEPESEEESEKEESEEEAEEGSEDEEDEEKGSDEEEEEGDEDEEDEDEDEDKGSDEEKSEKSDDSEGSEKSSKSEGSDESEGSDSSGKKKKKKDKKDKKKGKDKDKDKDKDKKGKNKDKPAEENKKGPAKDNPPDPPKLTIASVFDDLDELSNHLARTFASFQPKEEVNNLQKQPSLLLKNPSPPVSPGKELAQTKGQIHPASSLPLSNHGYKPENARPRTEDAGVQYGAASTVRRHASPEAIRAVQEYKQRKEQEKKRAESPEEIVSAQNDRPRREAPPQPQFYSTGRLGQGTYEKPRREERKAEQEEVTDFRKRTVSPNKPGTGPKFNQIAENYYANLYKKSTKNPVSAQKTIQDLYKYKPKPTFVEDESQPIAPYYENEFSIPKSRPGYETYDPRLKSQHKSPNERYDPLKSNKKQISDAVDVLTRRGGNNPNF